MLFEHATCTLAVVEAVLGTVMVWLPSLEVLPARVIGKELPPSSERVTSTLGQLTGAAVVPATFHVTLCELSAEEIRAVAKHEHLPQIVALELGDDLMRGPDGELLVSHIGRARTCGSASGSATLR